MDIALWGVLIGFTLGIIYKVIDELTLRQQRHRMEQEYARRRDVEAEEHARRRAEMDAQWKEIEERRRRIATILKDLPTTRRKREEASDRD